VLVEKGSRLPQGTKIWPGETIGPGAILS
jgi:hypothetical protein